MKIGAEPRHPCQRGVGVVEAFQQQRPGPRVADLAHHLGQRIAADVGPRAAEREAERRSVPVLLTTDHGSIHCMTPGTVFAKRDATANLRYKFGEDLRAERREVAVMVEDLPSWGLPEMGLGVRMLLAKSDHFFVYPTKLREYQARYRGSFQHGGVTPEEVIVPVALLTPRGSR